MKRKIWVLGLVAGICVLFAVITLFSAWNSGMSTGLMGNAEQATIMNVRFVEGAPTGDTIEITIGNHGSVNVTIQEGYANGIKATNINSGQGFIIPKATSIKITLRFPNGTLIYGTENQVKLLTSKGTRIVYYLTYDSTSASQYDPLKNDAAVPVPLSETSSTPWQDWSQLQQTAVAVFSVIAGLSVLGACKLAHYIVGPKSKTELCVVLFLVSVIVVSAMIAIVNIVFFPPQIQL